MSGLTNSSKWFQRIFYYLFFALSICGAVKEIPTAYRFERFGRKSEGLLSRYDREIGSRTYYTPIVVISTSEGERTVRGRESWRHRWYSEGERATVLELPGVHAVIGGPIMRWSLSMLILAIFAACGSFVFQDMRVLFRTVRSINI